MPSVLIVDEPSPEREELIARLAAAGHTVTVAHDAEEALALWRAQRHEIALVDETPRKGSGAELAARMKAETPHVFAPVLLVVRRPDVAGRIEALSVADDAVSRPYAAAEAHARLEALLRTRHLVDQLRVQRAESEARAVADAVTGLRNRVFLGERLNEEFKRSVRYNEPLSLVLLSVSGLRETVRTRGAPFADRVLAVLAGMCVKALRQIDIVCRYGPTELAALLPNTHLTGSLICAERLHREAQTSVVEDFVPVVTMGIAFFPGKDVSEPADLLRLGARALERAQEEGPGHICLVQHQGYLYQPSGR